MLAAAYLKYRPVSLVVLVICLALFFIVTHTHTHTHTHTLKPSFIDMQMQRNMTGQASKQHKVWTQHTRHDQLKRDDSLFAVEVFHVFFFQNCGV